MREKTVEAYLRGRVKELGGKAYKCVSPGNDGMPDRLIGLPGGRAVFVETKAPSRKASEKQLARQKELRLLGFAVFNEIDSREKVDQLIEVLRGMKSV